MKRAFGAALALVASVLVLSGCGSKSEAPKPSGGSKAEVPPTPAPPVTITIDPAATEPKGVKPGLNLTTYVNNKFTGPGETTSVVPGLGFDCDRNPYNNKEASLRYAGWLKVDKEGTYCIQVVADDQVTFTLNGKAVLTDFTGVKEQKVALKPGFYELKFDWQNNIGAACLTVKWAIGDCSGVAAIEPARFYH